MIANCQAILERDMMYESRLSRSAYWDVLSNYNKYKLGKDLDSGWCWIMAENGVKVILLSLTSFQKVDFFYTDLFINTVEAIWNNCRLYEIESNLKNLSKSIPLQYEPKIC